MLVLAWLVAVAITALVAWRAIHFVGNQLATGISLPPAGIAASFQPRPVVSPFHRPPGPSPIDAGIGSPISIVRPGEPTPQVVPEPVPPVPHPSPVRTERPEQTQPPQPTPAGPTAAPPPSQPPATYSDLRRVTTSGGTASFGCSPSNDLALLDVAPAAGYRQRPTTPDSSGYLVVFFVSSEAEAKIQAHCRNGRVVYTIET
jgi:outer membrane biosynthesis protein TonB